MKVLIGGSPTKMFHLKEFASALTNLGVDCKLVVDTDICNGFPSRKVSDWFQTRIRFNQLISEFKPDVIFTDRQSHFALIAANTKIPTFIQLRGDYWSEINWFKETVKDPIKRFIVFLKNRIAEKCFKNSTGIVPLCKYLEKIVNMHHPESKTHILQSGINSSRWYPSEGMTLKHPCVGLLQGAVIWGKAQEMLVLENVLKSMPDVTFYWAGDGPYRDKILSVLGKHDNFKWLGNLQYPDKVREYLTEIDVYALVSGIDMSPLTLQEAQLMKKPVVATNVGGIPELMKNNETGFLVEIGDANGWIEKLSLLINDEQKRKDMGEKGRKFVEENFNWGKIAKEFLDILKKHGIN
ncbi:MAG: glycosyltransferase family 4 protein [Nitrosopumilus sp.]|nr:glycosyltransferase family 4 protein [Nitrosopumilus sp.]